MLQVAIINITTPILMSTSSNYGLPALDHPHLKTLSFLFLAVLIFSLFSVTMRFCFLFLLHPFTFFTQPHNPLPFVSCQSVLSIYESVSILLVYQCLPLPKITHYLSFSVGSL